MDRKPDSEGLEDALFSERGARVLDQLRKKVERQEQRDLLRRVVAIHDDAFLDRLIALDIRPERAMVLRLTPLVFVAWADGSVDEREREAILKAAAQQGVAAETMAREILGDWLERPPDERILEKWKAYARKLWRCFTPDEQLRMRENLLGPAREVAAAAGGFLGLKTISAAEQRVLDDLARVLQ
jgi:hypothetical protein